MFEHFEHVCKPTNHNKPPLHSRYGMNPFTIRVLAIVFLGLGGGFLGLSRGSKDIIKELYRDESRELLVEARVPSHIMQKVLSGDTDNISSFELRSLDETQMSAVFAAIFSLSYAPLQANRTHIILVTTGVLFLIVGGIGFLITKKVKSNQTTHSAVDHVIP